MLLQMGPPVYPFGTIGVCQITLPVFRSTAAMLPTNEQHGYLVSVAQCSSAGQNSFYDIDLEGLFC